MRGRESQHRFTRQNLCGRESQHQFYAPKYMRTQKSALCKRGVKVGPKLSEETSNYSRVREISQKLGPNSDRSVVCDKFLHSRPLEFGLRVRVNFDQV